MTIHPALASDMLSDILLHRLPHAVPMEIDPGAAVAEARALDRALAHRRDHACALLCLPAAIVEPKRPPTTAVDGASAGEACPEADAMSERRGVEFDTLRGQHLRLAIQG